jgi:hypothetical protein
MAERAQGFGDRFEPAVEEQVGQAGLLLDAVGERDEHRRRGADVHHEVGPRSEQHLHVGRVAAAGEAAQLGEPGVLVREEARLVRAHGARPADELVRVDRVHEDRGGRAGGIDALDFRGNDDVAARGVQHRALGERRRCERGREQHRRYIVAPTTQGANSSSPKPSSSDLDFFPEAVSRISRKMRSPTCSTVSVPSTMVPQLTSMSSSMCR